MSCDISSVLFQAAGKQVWDALTCPLGKDCASKSSLDGQSQHRSWHTLEAFPTRRTPGFPGSENAFTNLVKADRDRILGCCACVVAAKSASSNRMKKGHPKADGLGLVLSLLVEWLLNLVFSPVRQK